MMSSPNWGVHQSGSSAAAKLTKADRIQRIIRHPVNKRHKTSLGKLKKGALVDHWYDIEGHPPPSAPRMTTFVTDIVVVKCGRGSVVHLNDAEYATFNGFLWQELTSRFPGADIKVEYGSATREVAVPTTTFQACVRVFGTEDVLSTNERLQD